MNSSKKIPIKNYQSEYIATQIFNEILHKVGQLTIPAQIIRFASLVDTLYFENFITNVGRVDPSLQKMRLSESDDTRVKSLTLKVKKQRKENINNPTMIKIINSSQLDKSEEKSFQTKLVSVQLERNQRQNIILNKDEKVKRDSSISSNVFSNLFSFFEKNYQENFQRLLRLKKNQNEMDLKQGLMKYSLFMTSEKKSQQKKENSPKRPIQVFTTDYNGKALPFCKKIISSHNPTTFVDVSFNILPDNIQNNLKIKNLPKMKFEQNELKYQKLNLIESTNCFEKNKHMRNLSTDDKFKQKDINEKKKFFINQIGKDGNSHRKISLSGLDRLKNCKKFLKDQLRQQTNQNVQIKPLEKKPRLLPFEDLCKSQKHSIINPLKLKKQRQEICQKRFRNILDQTPKILKCKKNQSKQHKVYYNQSKLAILIENQS